MDNDDFKALEAAFREAIRYRSSVGARSPVPDYDPAQLRQALNGPLPVTGTPGEEVIAYLAKGADPGLLGMAGSRMFGWVMGASDITGVAADWLTSAWGQNAANYFCSPAAAIAEEVASAWLLELLDLDPCCSVGFVTGATVANFTGILAARHRVLRQAGWDVEEKGMFGAPEITVIIGEEAHATAYAALQFAGLGRERVVRIPADDNGRMQAAACLEAIRRCRTPAIVILQAGHINSGDFDPFAEIIPAAHEQGAWVHVDGAFGLWSRTSPSLKAMTAGVENADSFATDGHKWLQVPYDCGYVICRDREAHTRAMTIEASYLPVEEHPDPSHFAPELSRRARGFATLAMIKHLGKQGVEKMVENHVRLARKFAALLQGAPGVEVLNRVVLNQFVVRFGDDDGLTKKVIGEVLQDGTCLVRGAQWEDKWVMRISVISTDTADDDIERSAAAVIRAWERVRKINGVIKGVRVT